MRSVTRQYRHMPRAEAFLLFSEEDWIEFFFPQGSQHDAKSWFGLQTSTILQHFLSSLPHAVRVQVSASPCLKQAFCYKHSSEIKACQQTSYSMAQWVFVSHYKLLSYVCVFMAGKAQTNPASVLWSIKLWLILPVMWKQRVYKMPSTNCGMIWCESPKKVDVAGIAFVGDHCKDSCYFYCLMFDAESHRHRNRDAVQDFRGRSSPGTYSSCYSPLCQEMLCSCSQVFSGSLNQVLTLTWGFIQIISW